MHFISKKKTMYIGENDPRMTKYCTIVLLVLSLKGRPTRFSHETSDQEVYSQNEMKLILCKHSLVHITKHTEKRK